MYKSSKIPTLAEVCEEKLLCCENTLPEGFEFSEEFERRMSGIIGAEPKPRLRGRLKAALVIAVIFAAGFCLGMGKEPLRNYIISKNSDGSKNVSFDVSSIKNPKQRIEEMYELSIPEGYKCVDFEKREDSFLQLWSRDGENGDFFFFFQYIPRLYRNISFSENSTYYFDNDGTQYYIDELDGCTAVVWEKDGYVFLVSGGLNKEDTLKLCRTLKISKNRYEFSQSGK